jgi:hypothetical protein
VKTKREGFLKMQELLNTNLNLGSFTDKPLTFVGQIMSWQLCSFYLGWNLQDQIYVDSKYIPERYMYENHNHLT